MRNVAQEMNLSETAFLYPQDDGFNLRWFTPSVEVELCGHATLASAHVLWESQRVGADEELRFSSRSGLLRAQRRGKWIELDFPARIVKQVNEPSAALLKALGVESKFVGLINSDYLIEVETEEMVRQLKPDFTSLKKMELRGAIVTSRASTEGFDFVSRFFAPGAGIDEDPVTGAAHCALGPYWKERLGKAEFVAYQASARGGVVRVRVRGDRVFLGGQAVTVMRAELL